MFCAGVMSRPSRLKKRHWVYYQHLSAVHWRVVRLRYGRAAAASFVICVRARAGERNWVPENEPTSIYFGRIPGFGTGFIGSKKNDPEGSFF
jgi:hypothetical protein